MKAISLGLQTNSIEYNIHRYNVELCYLESKDNNAALAIKDFVASKPKFRILLVGKRLNRKERETYDNAGRLNENYCTFVQVDFPLIDWTNEDVANFSSSLSLPYYKKE